MKRKKHKEGKNISAFSSAKELGYINCLACGTVYFDDKKSAIEVGNYHCPHCNNSISYRKNGGIQYVWIYILTSIILLFPANMLPISYTSYLGSAPKGDTIMSSVFLLWHHGSYLIAGVIFIASIFTPIFKIFVLIYLLTHRYPVKPPHIQTHLYHFIHFIGRWSMIDVFVVALLGALIHGRLAAINPGIGIFAFAGVVIFTMIATEYFDIRILWDNYRKYAIENSTVVDKKLHYDNENMLGNNNG